MEGGEQNTYISWEEGVMGGRGDRGYRGKGGRGQGGGGQPNFSYEKTYKNFDPSQS